MGEVSLKIEVPREKAAELHRFTDMYVYPKKFMTWSEYQRLLWRWSYDLIKIVYHDMCDMVFDLDEGEECPVDKDRIIDEVFDVLSSSEDIQRLGEKIGLTWEDAEVMDDHIHVNNKIEVYPHLEIREDGYKIYLVVYMK